MLDKTKIPPFVKESIDLYVSEGIPPGGFVTAVLENNLMGAFNKADLANQRAIGHIVAYLYNDVPYGVWGSPEKVQAHYDRTDRFSNLVQSGRFRREQVWNQKVWTMLEGNESFPAGTKFENTPLEQLTGDTTSEKLKTRHAFVEGPGEAADIFLMLADTERGKVAQHRGVSLAELNRQLAWDARVFPGDSPDTYYTPSEAIKAFDVTKRKAQLREEKKALESVTGS